MDNLAKRLMTLVVAALAVLALGTRAAGDDGLPVGQDFSIPIVCDGKTVEGLASISADKVLRIYYVKSGKVAYVTYTLTRGGDVGPRPPVVVVDPPTPVKDRPNKMFVIWESSGNDPAVADLVRRKEGWKKEAEKLGVTVIVADKDPAAATYPQAVKLAVAKGLPAIVWAKDAAQLGVDGLPKDEAALITLLQKKGGGK
jgi:hypothetical protein